MAKTNKVRTSITIDPNVLAAARATVEDPHSDYKSVAALIETCLREKVGEQDANADTNSDAPASE